MAKITVHATEVNIIKVRGEDYICLTDMFRDEEGQPYSQLDEKSQYCGIYWIMGDV